MSSDKGRSPESFFVFLVGVNSEWEEDREELGDIGVYNAYLRVGLPSDHIVFVKDAEATRSNCRRQLQQLLSKTVASSTFVFYYGGHGMPGNFSTHEESWEHKDVLEIIQANFAGDDVIVLADCCASGNLYSSLPKRDDRRHSYLCLMSTRPYVEAGGAWTMTSCWIQCLKCVESGTKLSLTQVVAFMADETIRLKADLLTTFVSAKCDECLIDTFIFPVIPSPLGSDKELKWVCPLKSIDPDGLVRARHLRVGDSVYYRERKGLFGDNVRILPMWFPATVLSGCGEGDDDYIHICIFDPISGTKWNAKVSMDFTFINTLFLASFYTVPDGFYKAQRLLARNRRYLDVTTFEPGTEIEGQWWDGKEYNGKIIDWREVNWEDYINTPPRKERPEPPGPYVAISWVDEDTYSIFPLERTRRSGSNQTVEDTYLRGGNYLKNPPCSEREALICSLETFGKSLCNADDELGSGKLRCIWPSDGIDWYDAIALHHKDVDWQRLPLHAMFTPKGRYCFVYFDEDDTTFLVPLEYVKPKRSHLCCCVIS